MFQKALSKFSCSNPLKTRERWKWLNNWIHIETKTVFEHMRTVHSETRLQNCTVQSGHSQFAFKTQNFSGSNSFGTMEICSRQGKFELMSVNHSARSGCIMGYLLYSFNMKVYCVFSSESAILMSTYNIPFL